MNKYDVEYNRVMRKMERGGSIDSYAFTINTPTGRPSALTYVQQLLVRTTKFKEWFGDWEKAAKVYLQSVKYDILLDAFEVIKTELDNRLIKNLGSDYDKNVYDVENIFFDAPFLNFDYSDEVYMAYKGVSKIIDIDTLEPRVVYHGTRVEDEFYTFQTKGESVGRPYAYFAYNKEYSKNFSKSNGLLYECFLNIKDAYWNIDFMLKFEFDTIVKDVKLQLKRKADLLNEQWDGTAKQIKLLDYIDYTLLNLDFATDGSKIPFWYLMATDRSGIFKDVLIANGYDGVMFGEELRFLTDYNDYFKRDLFTRAVTVFEPNQIKLADGRNVDFFKESNDIRYEVGGNLEKDIMLPDTQSRYAHLKGVLNKQGFDIYPTNMNSKIETFEVGGTIKHSKGATNDGKKGGYFEGRSHADGGIKAFNTSTNTPIEVEGGEVIITKKAVDDDTLNEFEGEMLTNREILSRINQSGGGVAFESGGQINSCNCNGSMFAYGGETMEDYKIIRKLQTSYDDRQNMKTRKMQYGHNLMRKMKQGGFI
jgi:hypothetical protein